MYSLTISATASARRGSKIEPVRRQPGERRRRIGVAVEPENEQAAGMRGPREVRGGGERGRAQIADVVEHDQCGPLRGAAHRGQRLVRRDVVPPA